MADLRTLIADCQLNRENLATLPLDESVKNELMNNLWPWLEAFAGAVATELDDHGQAINDLIDDSENILQPQMAAMLVGVFETGKILARELLRILEGEEADEIRGKRLRKMIKEYLQAATVASNEVAAVTIDLDELVDGDPEDEGEGDDDSEDEGEEDAANDNEDEDGDDDDDIAAALEDEENA